MNVPIRASSKIEKSSSSVQLVLDTNKAGFLSPNNSLNSSYSVESLLKKFTFSSCDNSEIILGPGLSYNVVELKSIIWKINT